MIHRPTECPLSFNLHVKPNQTRLEEWFNSISHFIAALLSISALLFLILKSLSLHSNRMLIASIIYGTSLIIMYTSSSLYHITQHTQAKRILKLIDHCSIYFLIAGSYTPFCLITLKGKIGWILFITIWVLSFLGMIFKIFLNGQYKKFSLIVYICMGWLAIVVADHLMISLTLNGFVWLLAGGLSYTFGVIFFILDKTFLFSHFIWHLFVILGSTLHFICIYNFVII